MSRQAFINPSLCIRPCTNTVLWNSVGYTPTLAMNSYPPSSDVSCTLYGIPAWESGTGKGNLFLAFSKGLTGAAVPDLRPCRANFSYVNLNLLAAFWADYYNNVTILTPPTQFPIQVDYDIDVYLIPWIGDTYQEQQWTPVHTTTAGYLPPWFFNNYIEYPGFSFTNSKHIRFNWSYRGEWTPILENIPCQICYTRSLLLDLSGGPWFGMAVTVSSNIDIPFVPDTTISNFVSAWLGGIGDGTDQLLWGQYQR